MTDCPLRVTTQLFCKMRALDKSQLPADQTQHIRLRDQLIEMHQVDAMQQAKRSVSALGLSHANDEDDLISEAHIALIGAVDEFEPERGVPFEAFLTQRIEYRLQTYARDKAGFVSHRAAARGVESVPLDDEDFAHHSPDFAAQWTEENGLKTAVDSALRHVWREVERGTERDRSAWERQREAMTMRFEREASFLEIAMHFEVTSDAARKLVERGLDRLRPHLYLELHN